MLIRLGQGIVISSIAKFDTSRIWFNENFKPSQCQKLWGFFLVNFFFVVLLFLFNPIFFIDFFYYYYYFMYLILFYFQVPLVFVVSYCFFYFLLWCFLLCVFFNISFDFFWSLVMVFFGCCARVTIKYIYFKNNNIHCTSLICYKNIIFVCKCLHHNLLGVHNINIYGT